MIPILEAKAAAVNQDAMVHHLIERYSKPGAPAVVTISGATDTEIKAEMAYTDDAGKKRTAAGVGVSVEAAVTALRVELAKPWTEETPATKSKTKTRA